MPGNLAAIEPLSGVCAADHQRLLTVLPIALRTTGDHEFLSGAVNASDGDARLPHLHV